MAILNTKIVSGELAGSASAAQLPDIPCNRVTLKAVYGNAGNVYLGGAGVTKVDASTDATTGIELDAGDEITLHISNLNLLYRICDNAGDDLTYIAETSAA
tara:strand:- start:5504 stop:5806 length:303 start_codon:yes stop_codon:yes gene_type:complete